MVSTKLFLWRATLTYLWVRLELEAGSGEKNADAMSTKVGFCDGTTMCVVIEARKS